MRIMATCSNCQRDLLLSQLVEGPGITGRCPWCGTLLAPHHTLLLTDTVQRAERAGAELERALESLLAPLRRLLDDSLFWQYQSDGLALFSRPGWWRLFRVPLDLPEWAVVADRFQVTPLLPLLVGDGHFLVLALSQNQIRLLEGTRDRLEEVELPGVPPRVRDALHGEEVERQVQLYIADRGGVGARGTFHGHGDARDLQEERILQFFRGVDRRLREVLAGEHAPMVLAAVEHLAPLWRQANTYPHLVDQTLPGNPEDLGADQLHAGSWPMVEPLFLRAQRKAAARHDQLAGTGLTSQDPHEITGPPRKAGSRSCLSPSTPAGPAAGSATGNAAPYRDASSAPRERAESATVTTLTKGGAVYVLPSSEVPGGGSAAAVFRY